MPTSHIPNVRLSAFRNRVLAAVTKPITPSEVADTIGTTPQRAASALWSLSRNGFIDRPCRGLYQPLETDGEAA